MLSSLTRFVSFQSNRYPIVLTWLGDPISGLIHVEICESARDQTHDRLVSCQIHCPLGGIIPILKIYLKFRKEIKIISHNNSLLLVRLSKVKMTASKITFKTKINMLPRNHTGQLDLCN